MIKLHLACDFILLSVCLFFFLLTYTVTGDTIPLFSGNKPCLKFFYVDQLTTNIYISSILKWSNQHTLLFLTTVFFWQDMYESVDLRQRRSSSPGYIDSPTYSRQSMSPLMPRSPQHYYRYGKSLLKAPVNVCICTSGIQYI